jgi:hypothetical protein
MHEAQTGTGAWSANDSEGGNAAAWLRYSPAPTFAVMALLTSVLGGDSPEFFCTAAHGASPLSEMELMYLLMSAFHSGPWLRLLSRRRNGVRQT